MMIAWKLTTDFNKQRHLFFDKIETDYVVETYICTCGHTAFITTHPEQNVDYTCKECDNTKFYDANSAWKNIVHFSHQNSNVEFSYEFDIQSDTNSISSLYIMCIPKDINFSRRKVIYSKKSVYSLVLSIDGEIHENYSLAFNPNILAQLKNNLTQHIYQHNNFNIPNSKSNDLTLAMVEFFLKNKHLKDFDFYYWTDIPTLEKEEIYINDALEFISNNPKAKSVKKAVYQNYVLQLDNKGRFDSTFIQVFSNHIQDVNILSKLLKLNFEYSIDSNYDKYGLDQMMAFLQQHYTEKQLLKLFSSIELNSSHFLFRDAISEFLYDIDTIENNFNKVPCKIQALHDEFVRCSKEERHKNMIDQSLSYSNEQIRPCIKTNTYQVKLPMTGKELFDWADALDNCMAGYFEMIKNHETLIYSFFQEDIVVFAVEICDNEVIQASAKYNADLTFEQNQVVSKWFKLFFQKKTQVVAHVA